MTVVWKLQRELEAFQIYAALEVADKNIPVRLRTYAHD